MIIMIYIANQDVTNDEDVMQAIYIIFSLIVIAVMLVVSIGIYFFYVIVPSHSTTRNYQYQTNELHQY